MTRSAAIVAAVLFVFSFATLVPVYGQASGEQAAPASGAAAPTGAPAPQAPQTGEIPSRAPDLSLLRTLGGLGLVVSLMVLGFLAARKYAPHLFNRRAGEQHLKIVESLSMGDRRSIAVVQFENSFFLVGNTSQQITFLAQLPAGTCFAATRDEKQNASAQIATPKDSGTSFRNLYEVEKKSISSVGKSKSIPPDVRAKMRQLREALEQ